MTHTGKARAKTEQALSGGPVLLRFIDSYAILMSDCKLRAKNCGGCPLLGLDYAAQLKQKESAVRALLGKYGPVHPIRGMDVPYHYRNKVISTFAPAAGGKLTSGIYAARTHKLLPVES